MRLSPAPNRPSAPVVVPQDVPVYRLKSPIFGADDALHPEGSIIATEEQPNLEMEPLNDLAKVMMKEYLAMLDVHGREVAEKTGKKYMGLADAFEQSMVLAKQEGKRMTVLNGQEATPMMGAKKKLGLVQQITQTAEAAPAIQTITGKKGKVEED